MRPLLFALLASFTVACSAAAAPDSATAEQRDTSAGPPTCESRTLDGLHTQVLRGADAVSFYYVPSLWQITHIRIERSTNYDLAAPIDIGEPFAVAGTTVPVSTWGIPSNARTLKGAAGSPYYDHAVLEIEAVPAAFDSEAAIRAAITRTFGATGAFHLESVQLAADPSAAGFRVAYIDEARLGVSSPLTPDTVLQKIDAAGVRFVGRGDAFLQHPLAQRHGLASMSAQYKYECGSKTAAVTISSVDTSTEHPFVYPAQWQTGASATVAERGSNLQSAAGSLFALAYEAATGAHRRIAAGTPWTHDQAYVTRFESIYGELRMLIVGLDAALPDAYSYADYGAGFVARTTSVADVRAAGARAQTVFKAFVVAAFPKLGWVVPPPADFDACMASLANSTACVTNGATDAAAHWMISRESVQLVTMASIYGAAMTLATFTDRRALVAF